MTLASDATHLYWTAAPVLSNGDFGHAIRRASKAGGAAETLATGAGEIAALALSGNDVVWLEGPAGGTGPTRLNRVSKTGGSPVTLEVYPIADGEVDLYSLQTDETHAYLIRRDFSAEFTYMVWKTPLAGGGGSELARHTLPVGIDSRSMYLGESDVFWAFQSGWIYRASREGEPPGSSDTAHLVVDDVDGVDGWVLDVDSILYISGGNLRRAPVAGGTSTEAQGGVNAYRAVALGPSWLAWGSRDQAGNEAIRIQTVEGALCTVVTSGVKSAYSTLVDGNRLYWTNTATKAFGGAIRWVDIP